MKPIVAVFSALALVGCAAGSPDFYPVSTGAGWLAPERGVPVGVRTSTGDLHDDIAAMFTEGYGLQGFYYFSGPDPKIGDAVETAERVGAAMVVANHRYTGQTPEAVALTMPPPLVVAPQDPDSRDLPEMAVDPHPDHPYSQKAVLFAPLRRVGFGYLPRSLTPREAQAIGSAHGLYIIAVRRGSPAYQVNILPGDIVLSINGAAANTVSPHSRQLKLDRLNRLLLVRDGRSVQKDVLLRASW